MIRRYETGRSLDVELSTSIVGFIASGASPGRGLENRYSIRVHFCIYVKDGAKLNTSYYFASKTIEMKRVTGIGGIFFKCQDPEKINQWYKTHLGLDTTPYGAKVGPGQDGSSKDGYTLWTPFPDKTKYFEPSARDFMINYRVENIVALVDELKKEGVTILDEIATYDEYGKFVHILDPEGNKIELWEPNK